MKWVTVVLSVPFEGEFTYSVPKKYEGEELFGRRVSVPFGSREKTAFVIRESDEAPKDISYEIREIRKVVDKEKVFNRDLLDTARWMSGMYLSPVGVNLSMMIPSAKRESETSPFSLESSFAPVEKLTADQERAVETLRSAPSDVFYLYGVTGSGKSEVFLRRSEDVIREGRQVLYLVPEITLTHQLSQEVYARFDGSVAILHSGLTPSQRLRAWRGIQDGSIHMVIGARSSVFAPFCNLGLIILDEEHEGTYKSGSSPRYHTRQVAQYRAGKWKAQLVMGSATPSLEAWNLMKTQRIRSIVMEHRIGEASFPRIRIVNIKGERRNVSRVLEEEMRRTLGEKKGVLLFLNRRGFTYGYECRSCGHVFQCPNCSVSLTYHKGIGKVVCHTCGWSSYPMSVCPSCSSMDIEPGGYGTENAEEEVRALFPFATIARLDTDIAGGDKEKARAIIDDFRDGRIDILLGTQMVAKGLNFPRLALIGILNADSSLNASDFRAGERTFSLLHQVTGRAGRYRDDGRVVIQTSQPSAPAILCAAEGDIERFYTRELSQRRETLFPPFSRLVNLTIRGKDGEKVREEAEKLYEMAGSMADEHCELEVFPASPCLVEKSAGSWRWHVLLRSTNISLLLSAARGLVNSFRLPRSLYLEVDVDPVSLF